MKRLTKTEMKALSMAVMCCERTPELYTKEYVLNLKQQYAEKSKIWKEQNQGRQTQRSRKTKAKGI